VTTATGTVGMVLPTFPQRAALDGPGLGRLAADAEAAGVDALWACDHLLWHGPVLEAFIATAVAAAATRRCTVGTAVLQLPLRDPHLVAKTAASIQEIAGGRLVLGVGAGAHPGEFAGCGVDFGARGALVDDGIDALRAAWTPSEGRYGQRPAPEPIPIWVGGSSPSARRRAARSADGWMPMFLAPAAFGERQRQLDDDILAAGRDPSSVRRAAFVFVRTGHQAESARADGLAWMASLYQQPAESLARHLVSGSPADCAAAVADYFEAGADHVCLFVADDEPLPHVESILGLLTSRSAGELTVQR
jgi:alkanesulfonate monooxygenase